MKVSIAIPAYEYKGEGWLFLSHLLNGIFTQTHKNYEVVISDQSKNSDIKNICETYSKFMPIKRIDGSQITSMAANFNSAIKNCEGDLIKTMCCDDFFVDNTALEKIVNKFTNSSIEWLLNGCVHAQDNIYMFYDKMIPFYNHKIHLGKNTISSPTVLTMKNKNYLDESLMLLVDCELYKRLYNEYGQPAIINDPLVCNRMHANQAQKIHSEKSDLEVEYCRRLYGE